MIRACLALILSLGALDAAPAAFEVDVAEGKRVFRGVATTVEIRALDASGALLANFRGFARIDGAVTTLEGKAVTRAGPFVGGRVVLAKVLVDSGTLGVQVEDGEATGRVPVTVLPGFLTLLPPLVAIVLALLTRQVLLALFCGVWVGALLHHTFNPLEALLLSADTYVVSALADADHAHILIFSLSLAGMVGVITRIGGIRGIVDVVAPLAKSSRSGQLSTWFMGLLIFFDDYANVLIVGNTMRPFTDRLRISREKLAFLIDATAAPVATIGIISTWTAYQLGLIGDTLEANGVEGQEPYAFFLRSIPYSFYSLFMLLLVFVCGWTMRDFGPMRRAEERCRKTGAVLREGATPLVDESVTGDESDATIPGRWYNAAIPIGSTVLFTLIGLYVTGKAGLPADSDGTLGDIIGAANAYRALLWAGLGASLVAGLLAISQGHGLSTTISSWVQGVRSLILAVVILLLAWSISATCKDLNTGDYVLSLTRAIDLSPRLVPALTFVTAGVIAFATGTSYGTMAILIPIVLPLAFTLTGAAGLDAELGLGIALATLSAILGGSVFGDHCSPISDTTVLSSMASASDHVDHVRTQIPYAALVAGVCVPAYLLIGWGVSVVLVLMVGAVAVAGAFWFLSRG